MDVDSYIDSIAKALAQRGGGGGRATAMIGAGFSRNAEKRTESARNFPLWILPSAGGSAVKAI